MGTIKYCINIIFLCATFYDICDNNLFPILNTWSEIIQNDNSVFLSTM